jgi:hypothetical protein
VRSFWTNGGVGPMQCNKNMTPTSLALAFWQRQGQDLKTQRQNVSHVGPVSTSFTVDKKYQVITDDSISHLPFATSIFSEQLAFSFCSLHLHNIYFWYVALIRPASTSSSNID